MAVADPDFGKLVNWVNKHGTFTGAFEGKESYVFEKKLSGKHWTPTDPIPRSDDPWDTEMTIWLKAIGRIFLTSKEIRKK